MQVTVSGAGTNSADDDDVDFFFPSSLHPPDSLHCLQLDAASSSCCVVTLSIRGGLINLGAACCGTKYRDLDLNEKNNLKGFFMFFFFHA